MENVASGFHKGGRAQNVLSAAPRGPPPVAFRRAVRSARELIVARPVSLRWGDRWEVNACAMCGWALGSL
mgnify:CR=1 FL=1